MPQVVIRNGASKSAIADQVRPAKLLGGVLKERIAALKWKILMAAALAVPLYYAGGILAESARLILYGIARHPCGCL